MTEENKMQKICMIGAGSWGAALAHQLRKHPQNKVTLLARSEADCDSLSHGRIRQLPELHHIPPLHATTKAHCLAEADMVFLAAPVSAHPTAFAQIAEYTRPDCPIIFCAKGLIEDEKKGGLLICEYGERHFKGRALAMLTGPSFADEVLSDLPAALLIASQHEALCTAVSEMFKKSSLRIYQGDDIIGASVGGATKNVIAIAAGIVAGKGFGDNARAALVTRGLAEIGRLADALGGSKSTISGLAGLGDLLLSAAGPHSRNMAFGYHLGAGKDIPSKLSEGRFAANLVVARASYEGIEMPIARAVDDIINHNAPIEDTITAILSREAYNE